MADREEIDLKSFKRAQNRTAIHMEHLINKLMSNPLPTMTLLQRRGHLTTNIFPWCGVALETIQHMHQCINKRIRSRWTDLVDALRKWIETRNMDPDIAILLSETILYITGERNDLPQCTNINLHSVILCIVCPSITLCEITKCIARTQQTYFTHIGSKKRGFLG